MNSLKCNLVPLCYFHLMFESLSCVFCFLWESLHRNVLLLPWFFAKLFPVELIFDPLIFPDCSWSESQNASCARQSAKREIHDQRNTEIQRKAFFDPLIFADGRRSGSKLQVVPDSGRRFNNRLFLKFFNKKIRFPRYEHGFLIVPSENTFFQSNLDSKRK